MAVDVLFANQPWYYFNKKWRFGVRAGSRWPHTLDHPGGYKPFPFFLAYGASWMQSKGFSSAFVDAITTRMSYQHFYNKVKELKPRYVVLETATASIENDLAVAKKLYEMGIKVIMSGPYASVMFNEIMKHHYVFAVVQGDLELTVQNVLEREQPGVYQYDMVQDIDEIPFPYRDDTIWLYQERTHGYVPRQISLLASRGCPYQCTFCQWPQVMWGHKYRQRSVENIKQEIDYLVDRYGRDIFLYFDDDTFNLKESRTLEIANMIGRTGLKWSAMCRIDTISKEAWTESRKNGLIAVNVGLETASEKLMKDIKKRLDIDLARDQLKHLKQIGIYTHVTVLVDMPGETPEDRKATLELLDEIQPDSYQVASMAPQVGTALWEQLGRPMDAERADGLLTLEKTKSFPHKDSPKLDLSKVYTDEDILNFHP